MNATSRTDRRTQRSHNRLRPVAQALAIGALSAAALSLSGCGKEQTAQAAAPHAPQAAPVSVAEVITRQVTQERSFSGVIEAIERAQLRPRVAGTVEQVRLQPGALVHKGDVLFVIDPRPYQADVARLEAAAASSQLKAELAQAELVRAQRLLADNAIAQRDHDERQSTARQLEAAARADKAALQSARLNLEWTQVRAPFDGRVGKAEVTTGNLVDGNTVLTTLVSANPMYVSFNGDEGTFLQVGKLADLIVLDKNPLENIRNTESIKYTMVNGRLYDAETMNEVGNYNKPRTRFYWETGRNVPAFDWHDGDTHTFGYGHVCD